MPTPIVSMIVGELWTLGCSGHYDVSGEKSGSLAKKTDDLLDIENHILCTRILDSLPIQLCRNTKTIWILDNLQSANSHEKWYFGRHNSSTNRCPPIKHLPCPPLSSTPLKLPSSMRYIIANRVPKNILQRLVLGDIFSLFSDD